MAEFKKYPHIERLGNDEVEGITVGKCYVFPKIDGTQSSVWMDDGVVYAGSRRRVLSLESDNAGFYAWVLSDEGAAVRALLEYDKDWILYGEWLVPHSLKTYRDDAWRRLYIFDIYDRVAECFLDYDYYAAVFDDLGFVDYIQPLEIVTNPSDEHLLGLLDRNTYLIKDGCGVGEGIVIKRYDFKNRYGRTTWAKVVRNEFREQNRRVFGHAEVEMDPLEARIAREFVTAGRVAKLKEKMREDGPLVSKRIPELLGRIWNEIIQDEMWNILKRHRRATINFGKLQNFVIHQTKVLSPELFGVIDDPQTT